MAALRPPAGFKAQIISVNNDMRAQCLFDSLPAAKDWAEQQSTEDDETVQVVHLRAEKNGALISEIYNFIDAQWKKVPAY